MRRFVPLRVCLAALLAPGAVDAALHGRTLERFVTVVVGADQAR